MDGVRLLADADEATVLGVAAALGLSPLGWVITTNERPGGEPYGGKVFLSGLEVCTAAALQQRFGTGVAELSRFVTVVLEQADDIEPRAYQVSDQCQALVRDGCLLPGPKDPLLVATRSVAANEMAPTIVYHDRPLDNGAEFVPDAFLVKVIVMTAGPEQALFVHNDFPSLPRLGLSGAATATATAAAAAESAARARVKATLVSRQSEPYHKRLSDFALLVALARTGVFDAALIARLGAELVTKQPLSQRLSEDVDVALLQHQLLDFK